MLVCVRSSLSGCHSGMCCEGAADGDASEQGQSVVNVGQFAGVPLDLETVSPPHGKPSGSLAKYWSQRYRLFSRFDQGVLLDEGKGEVVYWCV